MCSKEASVNKVNSKGSASLKSPFVSVRQNRLQKVFNGRALRFCEGALGLCGGIDTLRIEKLTDL